MSESNLAPLELAKSALTLLQDGSDSEDEVLALSLVTSAVALHLLKQPQYLKRQSTFETDDVQYYHSRSSSAIEMPDMKISPRFEVRHEAEINDYDDDLDDDDKLNECSSSIPQINDVKIEFNPLVLLSEDANQLETNDEGSNHELNEQSEESNQSFGKKRKRQWSKFEDERRRVLLRLNSNDSLDLFCAEPKITDYMSIFLDSLKMDITTFNLLLSLVRKDIEHQNTCMRMTVAPEQRLAIILRYLSTGESYNAIEKSVKVSKSFLCVNIPALSKALWTNLKEQYMKLPSSEGEWASKAEEFDSNWQFPLCLGVLTRRHFKFKTPREAKLFALIDANKQFLHVEIEKENESIYVSQENTPPPQSIGFNRVLPYVYIADNGFDLDEHLMTPFTQANTVAQRIFNARLKVSTGLADQTFRILLNRFKILTTPLHLLQPHIDDLIRVCCVLHNFLMQNNPDLYAPDAIEEEPMDSEPEKISLYTKIAYNEKAENVRQEFADYFTNEGVLPTLDVKLFEEDGTSTSNVLLDMFST